MFDPTEPDDQLSTMALTRLLVLQTRLPVIAAGGIMDGAGLHAALTLGATAARSALPSSPAQRAAQTTHIERP